MDPVYEKIRLRALEIADRLPEPAFYRDFPKPVLLSREFFLADPTVARLRGLVAARVDNDLGHGMGHAEKVTIDAGALFLIHALGQGFSAMETDRGLLLVQCAGLLHDVSRREKHHALAGALAAREILKDYPFSEAEVGHICLAIRNHEAFKAQEPLLSPLGRVISDCLYDADKFRWGPDNFTDTVWHMISFFHAPVSVFLDRYPQGVKGIKEIRTTFRTETGRKYGPGFVDAGLAIGEEIRRILQEEYA